MAFGAFAATVVSGMRATIIFLAVLNVAAAILVQIFVKADDPKSVAARADEDEKAEPKVTVAEIIDVMKRKEMWFFSVIAMGCWIVCTVVPYYFSAYFSDVHGADISSVAIVYYTTGIAGGIILGPLFGSIADAIGSVVKMIVICLTVVFALLLVILLNLNGLSFALAVAIELVMVGVGGGVYNIMFASVNELGLSARVAGTCIGVGSVIAYSPDAFMYLMFGNWLDAMGVDAYPRIFMTMTGFIAVAIILACYLYFGVVKKARENLAEAPYKA